MTEILSFPGLGLNFNISRVAFSIAGIDIYWYGIIIAAAFLAGSSYTLSRAKVFGLDGDRVMDVVLGGVLFGIIGARAYYVLFRWDTYSGNLISIFDVRGGGIAVYGGIIAGFLAAAVVAKMRGVKILSVFDLGAGGMLLGQAIGRWGNFVNMEAFGANTSAPWGMTSQTITWYLKQNSDELLKYSIHVDPLAPVHPTFFYESMWCLLGFAFIAWFTKRRRFDGEIILFYLGWYGLGRFFIEGLRTDSLMLGTMRVSRVLALLCVVAATFALTTILARIKRSNDPDFLPLYVTTDESKAILAGTFYKKAKPEDKADAENTTQDHGKTEADTGDGDSHDAADTLDTSESATDTTPNGSDIPDIDVSVNDDTHTPQ